MTATGHVGDMIRTYSQSYWDSFRDHIRDVPWVDISDLGDSATSEEFCECVDVAVDIHISTPFWKYEVKRANFR